MENPTIVVITDRNDLDGQLFGVFSLAQDLLREQPVQADTRQELRAKLANRPSGGIVFATIQKFMPGEDEDSVPGAVGPPQHRGDCRRGAPHAVRLRGQAEDRQGASTRAGNDAPATVGQPMRQPYRYQVGYAQHLRDALPNATFVAFTGTPVSSEDRDTRAVFGDYIHVYDMQQAKEDGATVAIYYESRLAKLGLKADDTAADRRRGGRTGRGRGREPAGPAEEPLGGAGEGGRRRAAHRQRGGRPGGALRGAQQGADRQGHGGGHEPRHLRRTCTTRSSSCGPTGTTPTRKRARSRS